jgi:hypothetical protein
MKDYPTEPIEKGRKGNGFTYLAQDLMEHIYLAADPSKFVRRGMIAVWEMCYIGNIGSVFLMLEPF